MEESIHLLKTIFFTKGDNLTSNKHIYQLNMFIKLVLSSTRAHSQFKCCLLGYYPENALNRLF